MLSILPSRNGRFHGPFSGSLRKRPNRGVLALRLLLALAGWVAPPDALAQRLEIRVEGESTEVRPILWGRVTDDFISIGGELLRRTKAPHAGLSASPPAPPAPSHVPPMRPPAAPSKPRASTSVPPLEARYDFRPAERDSCGSTARFRAFATLLDSLAKRIEAITTIDASGWDTCATAVTAEFQRKGFTVERVPAAGTAALSILVSFRAEEPAPLVEAAPPPLPDQSSSVSSPAASAAPAPNAPRPARIAISGRDVPIEAEGYFVVVAPSFRELELVVEQPGYEPIRRLVMPIPLPVGSSPAPAGAGFSEILVVSGAGRTSIAVVAVPPSAMEIVLDMTTGLGFGYGHGLPGEARGRRGAIAAALTHRELVFGLGGRLSLDASAAPDSVVPWTLMGRATGTLRGELWEGAGTWRLGAGSQLFVAKISPEDDVAPGSQAVVPEQVLSPLLSSATEVRLRRLLFAAHLDLTPLYVVGSGFYPSLNPGVELGAMLDEGAALVLGYSVTRIRYPAIGREISLQLDTLYLSLRQGF